MNETEMAVVRRAYAKQVMGASGVDDPCLEAALAKLPREAFLGPGPWEIMRLEVGYRMTPDDDPVHLYQNVLVGMIPEKELNNGQPSFVTFLICLGRLRKGKTAVHIGAGQGYYTAIIAELVGASGRVTAIEYEQELATRAAANLSAFPHVRVIHGDGTKIPLEPADVIYVNCGRSTPSRYLARRDEKWRSHDPAAYCELHDGDRSLDDEGRGLSHRTRRQRLHGPMEVRDCDISMRRR